MFGSWSSCSHPTTQHSNERCPFTMSNQIRITYLTWLARLNSAVVNPGLKLFDTQITYPHCVHACRHVDWQRISGPLIILFSWSTFGSRTPHNPYTFVHPCKVNSCQVACIMFILQRVAQHKWGMILPKFPAHSRGAPSFPSVDERVMSYMYGLAPCIVP